MDELLPYKGLQRNQMLKDKKSFLWLKKGKVLFCTLLAQKTQLLPTTQAHCRGSLSAAILHLSTHSSGKGLFPFAHVQEAAFL